MLKSINYIRSIFSLCIFLLVSACSDSGGFFTNRMSGEEFSDPQEAKLRKYYSRLEEQKNYEYLITALKGTDVGLDIVGDGSLRDKLEILANDNKVDVRFLGKMPNSKLLVLYDKYMYFVSSSLYEGNPKVVLEAMSSGCIVLINKNRNVEEIIQHKKNGLFFSVQDDTFLDTFTSWRKREGDLKKISIDAMKTIQNNNSLDIIVESENKDYLQLVNEE